MTPPTTKPLAPAAAPAALHAAIPPPRRALRGDRGQQPQRRWHRSGRGTTLQATAGGQRDGGRGCGRHRGASREHSQADQDRPAVPVPVTQSRAEHQQSAEEHGVTGRDQRAVGLRGMQADQHGRQGSDHDGDAKDVGELDQAQRGHGREELTTHRCRLPPPRRP